jgi:tellurite resistance protein TerC
VDVTIWGWAAVVGVILAALALDLFVFHRDPHAVTVREAVVSTVAWVVLGLVFGLVVWRVGGGEAAGEYYAGYLIEKALSVENIFVFALVLGAFAAPRELQHRVLFLGVLGALVLRGAFVAGGAAFLDAFHWAIYVFGAVLVASGVRMARHRSTQPVDPSRNAALRLLRRFVPVADRYHGPRLLVRDAGRLVATPLLAVVVVIEATDVVFAVDSIPAIFAVTDKPFLVFTSTAFAMLGLRAMYFLLGGVMQRFAYLTTGLAAVLVFVGVKMLLADVVHIPVWASLLGILVILAIAIGASLHKTAATANDALEVSS